MFFDFYEMVMGILSKLFKHNKYQIHDSEEPSDDFSGIIDNETEVRPIEEMMDVSYGSVMPAEENQFNYSGSYEQYFTHVFEEEFPGYEVRKAAALRSDSTVFTFWQGGRKALVVEVMSQNSSAKKLRSDCARDGIPYLRFYHNHDGWWNTRSYVTKRVQGALGGI